ncbi:MAG: succinylglutamate desuccinylase/aspartoacylase family protein [Rhodanobacteraceae bacterium]|nr:succinylglutamate desuccinylase/aspartoacylase family protein [Rhodanobacteraceae bacterium]MBK7043305.1 succinylglutamate desuccinylase/aspartoacylase family protein [Rhodanobacteraceae bacterium]MBP9155038.1 succinylglutamate desuccinylase/aspartoacylase family protein [Xanthomonadales bacterium]HQW82332.1 succinylglutamate desuccinylase/aspartoacylase family protein [Pseudomonadota bacterium]
MNRLFVVIGLLLSMPGVAQDFPIDDIKPVPAELTPATPATVAPATPVVPAMTPAAVTAPTLDAVAVAPLPVLAEGAETTPLSLLGQSVLPGTRAELRWSSGQSFDGTVVTTPVIVVHGSTVGPRICLTAAVHGDELNGIEIIRRLMNELDPAAMSGTVIGVPIVNFLGYARGSRYLPDRRDLNRYFPGSATGSSASRIAHSFFEDIAVNCQALVDFHTGSFDRKNLPQVRGDLRIPAVLEFSRGFGATAVLHSPGARGMLRRAAVEAGIPAITFEVGSPMRLEPAEIDHAVQALHTLLHKMGMTRSFRMWAEPQALFYSAKWVRSDTGGMLFSEVNLGDRVRVGQRLGKVVDPVQNSERAIVSPVQGKLIGMALNQIVLPGFATYHIGVQTDEQQMIEAAANDPNNAEAAAAADDESPDIEDGDAVPIETPRDDEDGER